MTPSQINAAIATWMGWTDISPTFHVGFDPDTGQPRPIPNFHGDLNACREAAMHLQAKSPLSYITYAATITSIVAKFNDQENEFSMFGHDATAPQRCEALLRTLNLWKE